MALAFSTGGSGYMRSDFMISDAAIPQRMEELKAEQSGGFSQVLSGMGSNKDVPKDTVELMKKFTGSDGKIDMHQLAKAVADGEVRVEDIPAELITQELFTELAQLVKVPEKDEAEPTKDAAQEAMAELAAMFTAQQTVQPESVSDKSAEISELAQPAVKVAEAVQEKPVAETPDIQPVQTEQTAEVTADVVTEQSSAVQAEAQPKQQKSEEAPAEDAEVQVSAVQEQPVVIRQESDSTQQGGQNGQQLSGQEVSTAPQTKTEEPQQSEVTEFTVRTAEPQQKQPESSEQPQQDQQEPVVFQQHSTQRSRVVSKSDELEMIRGGQDTAKTSDSAVQVQPQTVQQEAPVVFARADGTEVQVRPAEVVKQVADRLIEKASDLREGETEYTVTLEPQDLGKITVRMTKTADGAVSVSIAAENSRTLRIIEENGAHIQDSLKNNGVQLENWQTVSGSRQEMHAEDYRGSSKNPYRESEGQNKEDDSDGKGFAEIIASM